MRRSFALLIATATLVYLPALVQAAPAAAPPQKTAFTMDTGDTIRIAGTNLGCAVATRDGSRVVECLPVVRRAGSYGTVISDHKLLVVHFTDSATARTVFSVTQHSPRSNVCR